VALIAVAADKGSPGVTTSAVALAAVWPRPVLLAECDPAGGDLVFRLPAADRGRLDTRRGLLSLAVAARRGMAPGQVWEHVQKVHGGLDVLAGVTSAEQAAGLQALWGTVGTVLAGLPEADVIADCGRIGVDGPFYDLLAQASATLLITGASLGEVIRLRERATAVAAGLQRRGRPGMRIQAVIIANPRHLNAALSEVTHALGKGSPATVAGGIAHDPKSAESLAGEWGGKLDKSMLIRTARQIAADLAGQLPPLAAPGGATPGVVAPGAATPAVGPGVVGPVVGAAPAAAAAPGLVGPGAAGLGAVGPGGAPALADRQLSGSPREPLAPPRPVAQLSAGRIAPASAPMPAPAPVAAPGRPAAVPPTGLTPLPPAALPGERVAAPRGRHADPAWLPPAEYPPAEYPQVQPSSSPAPPSPAPPSQASPSQTMQAQFPPAQFPPAKAQLPPEAPAEASSADQDDDVTRWPGSFAPASGTSPDASGQW
jgi:hypothetical protein